MGIYAPSRRSMLFTTICVSILTAAGLDVFILNPVTAPAIVAAEAAHETPAGLRVLSAADRALYREAMQLQRQGSFAQADAALARVSNPVLKASVMGERLSMQGHSPAYNDMAAWLAVNNELPAAEKIYRNALAQKPAGGSALTEPDAPRAFKGVTNGYGKSVLRDTKAWEAGMDAFRKKHMSVAARQFQNIADKAAENNLSANDKSAAAFWAYRAFNAVGDKVSAKRYLTMAAEQPPAFYSLLAGSHIGGKQGQPQKAEYASEAELAELLTLIPVKRAVALKEIGEDALAEQELRAFYPSAGTLTRSRLLSLAHHMNLPAIQMNMASGITKDALAFPVPNWEPHAGYQVEKALLLAIMRQESGFNPNARSSAGAMGLMQLMPATAAAMQRGSKQLGSSSLDPSVNITLGQRYLEHLMETDHIGDNLVYLMAAYNAGPGSLQNWLRTARGDQDPLLFIESIPFDQTRDYVVNVMANYWVYSELLDVATPDSLQALASGQWPRYNDKPQNQLLSLLNRTD